MRAKPEGGQSLKNPNGILKVWHVEVGLLLYQT